MDPVQLSEDTPIVVATDNGELLLVTENGNDRAEIAADGAEIVVVETDDGQQQIQLVTEDGGQLLTLPPELASRLKENLSGLVAGDGVQQLLVTQDGYEDGAVELEEGAAELQEGAVALQEGAVELQEGTVALHEGAVELQEGAADLQEGAVELQEGAVELQEGAVELQGEGIELQEGAEELQGAVVLEEGTVVLEEGAVALQDEDKFDEADTKVLALEGEQPDDMTEAAKVIPDPRAPDVGADPLASDVGPDPHRVSGVGDDQQLVSPEVTADSLTSDGANCTRGEVGTGRRDEVGDDHVMNDQMVNFMKVEEESATSDAENIEEEYVDEEIGEFLGDLGFTGPIDGPKMDQPIGTQSVGMTAAATGAPKNDASQWTESTVTSASGAELKIRLPTGASLGGVATPQQPQPTFRVVRPLTTSGPPIQPPQPPYKKKKPSADVDAWAARTRRRASHGIARAVAAVRRAEDSDSFDSDDDEEESAVPAPAPPPGQPKRGRGRPRKPGGFSCQLCPRRLETQARFFQHLRDHYEKPDGQEEEEEEGEGEAPAAEDAAGVSERLEPIPEQGGDGDGPSVLNVDIIASETVKIECEHCDLTFFSEEDFERHTKTHIQEALDAADESSESESEQETVADDLGDGHTGDAVQLAHSGGEPEPPPAPEVDPVAADRYEMKNLKKCDDCPKLFTTLSSLRNHRQRMHNMNGAPISATNAAKLEYECDECHVTYTSQKIHERHKRLHENKAAGRLPHRCTACGVSFLTSMLLAHHAQKEHPETCQRRRRQGDGPPRPNGRPPGSSNKDRQAVYDQIRELESGMFGCVICSKEAKTKNQMFYHVSIKHKALEGHKCPTCDKAFFTETALRVHERTHTGERPFVCDYCSRRFRQQADLNSHVMSLHTMERPFLCRFCGKAFARKYSLTIHMRCHTNERNYRCPVCNKGFRASTYLTGHMKIHTGEKAHACPICHKTFRMRSDMKRHIFTHSRDRPHPRSLRSLTVQVADGQADEEVMLLDPNQLCLQLLTGENGESMVITEGGQTMVLDGSQTVVDQQTGEVMVPESAISELDETAMASMYLMADGQSDAMELT